MKPASIRTTATIVAILVIAIAGINLFRVISAEQSAPTDPQTVLKEGSPALSNDAHAYIFPVSEVSYIPFLDSSRKRPDLKAKSAIVYDTQTSRFLFAMDTKKRLPIASLTKIMSAVIVFEKLNFDDVVTVGKESVRVDGDKRDLTAGERIKVSNLLAMMLIKSSNDAAYALVTHAKTKNFDFVAEMNAKARELSMNDTLFLDAAGLNDNGYATVQDLVKLVVYSNRYKNIWQLLREKEITITSEDGAVIHTVENTNQLLDEIPNISGGKTGYTDLALGCMVLMVDIPGHKDTIISIILGSSDRFGDTRKLVDWIIEAYRWE